MCPDPGRFVCACGFSHFFRLLLLTDVPLLLHPKFHLFHLFPTTILLLLLLLLLPAPLWIDSLLPFFLVLFSPLHFGRNPKNKLPVYYAGFKSYSIEDIGSIWVGYYNITLYTALQHYTNVRRRSFRS